MVGALLCGLLAGVPPAGVETPTSEPVERADATSEERWRVLLLVTDDDRGQARGEAIRAALVDLPIELEVRPVPSSGDAAPRLSTLRADARDAEAELALWVRVEDTAAVFLFVAPTQGDDTLVRDLGRPEALTDDDLAIVVRGSVQVLLDGGRVGIEVPPEPEPEAEPEPEPALGPEPVPSEPVVVEEGTRPPPEPKVRSRLLAAYALDTIGTQAVLGHGAAVGLELLPHPNVPLSLRFRAMAPVSASIDAVAIDVFRYPLELRVGGQWARGRIELGGDLVAVLEPTYRRATLDGGGGGTTRGPARRGASPRPPCAPAGEGLATLACGRRRGSRRLPRSSRVRVPGGCW